MKPNPKPGQAQMYRGRMYFHPADWKIISAHAQKQHKSPTQIVIDGLKRGFKNARKAEKERMVA